jgi:prepilin signal peptidase PulO-like enzyme (type II secretory pathway)
MSVLVFLGVAAFLTVCDWRHRAVPRSVCVAGTALGMIFAPSLWYLVGVVIGFTIALLADLPTGDVAVGGMIGAWLGIDGTLLAWMVALLTGHLIWACWESRWINWPGEWPFTPLLLVPACAIVLVKGGW